MIYIIIYALIAFGVGVWVYTVNHSWKNALIVGSLWVYWLPRFWWILYKGGRK